MNKHKQRLNKLIESSEKGVKLSRMQLNRVGDTKSREVYFDRLEELRKLKSMKDKI